MLYKVLKTVTSTGKYSINVCQPNKTNTELQHKMYPLLPRSKHNNSSSNSLVDLTAGHEQL